MTTNNGISAVQAAENKIEAIKMALVNGDEKIKISDLAQARNELEFVQLKSQAAEIAKEKAAKAERRANLLSLQKKLAAVNDSRAGVEKKFSEFEKSLSDFLQTATLYQQALNTVRTELQAANFYHSDPPGVIEGIEVSDIRRVVGIGGITAENYDPHEISKRLLEASLADFDRNL